MISRQIFEAKSLKHFKLKYGRGPKLEGRAFANFRNSSGTEEEPSQKRERNGGKIKRNKCYSDRESKPGPIDN